MWWGAVKVVSVIRRLGKVALFNETNLENWDSFLGIVGLAGVILCERNSGSFVLYSGYFLWWNQSINKVYPPNVIKHRGI